jgi:hypothetical protein
MRRGVLGVTAFVTVGLALVPSVRAVAATTVSGPDRDDVVTITVPVDCVGCAGKKAPDGRTGLGEYWRKTAQKAWNGAFDKWRYCNSYRFHLDIDIQDRPADAGASFGRHRLTADAADGRGGESSGWGGAPEQTPGGDPGQSSPDGTRYYEYDAEGGIAVDATVSVIVHEFGHVMGLGDDRDAAGDVIPGREGTVMEGGAKGVTPNTKLRIDRALVDRIGRQLENRGKITCGQQWKGTIEGQVTAPGCSPSVIEVRGRIGLNVHKDGAVTGRGTWTEAGYSCGGETVDPMILGFPITGHKDGGRFTLQPEGQAQLLQMDDQGGHASGVVDNPGAGGYGSTLTFTVDCQSCRKAR